MEKERISDDILIDTHVHLNEIENVDQVIRNARNAGVKHMVAVGMDKHSNDKTMALADQHTGVVYPAVGYHPWEIRGDDVEETLLFIESHLDRCVALGEVGLDYRVKVKKPLQRDVFSEVLRIAARRKKPVVVHSRYSHNRTHQMVAVAGIEKAVFHWYSGPLDILDRILGDGYYVSATPALAYSISHQAAIAKAPLEKILIETDSPVEYAGIISEPADLIDTLRLLSELKGVTQDDLGRMMTENARYFFELE